MLKSDIAFQTKLTNLVYREIYCKRKKINSARLYLVLFNSTKRFQRKYINLNKSSLRKESESFSYCHPLRIPEPYAH